ncbi:MAG: FAD-binding oxidoreductase [Chloroflexota bacterium]|nr:FAD-binding oxidoreductase [Chloroflexota bacterium]
MLRASTTHDPLARPIDLSPLAAHLSGALLEPESEGYDQARLIWNLVHDRRPAAIVQAADVDDVRRAVHFARDTGIEIAVRSGGHSLAGFSTGDGVLVIDLRGLRGLHIDPETRMVVAGAGLTAGEVTSALAAHDLAIPFGDTASVGIAGLTLGGGIGYLTRKFGLAIDRVRSMEVVTANGDFITASVDQNPDLYWALRGGGGNFGIVTRFAYEAVPLGETLAGALFLPLTAEVLRGVQSIAAAAPEELTVIVDIVPAPEAPFIPAESVGTPIAIVLLVYAGDPAEGQTIVDRFRSLARPIADLVAPMPYPGIYEFSAEAETPAPAIVRSMFTDALDDAAIERIVARMSESDGPMVKFTQLRVLGGAMGRVPADATAFAHRGAQVLFGVYTIFVDPTRIEQDLQWTDAYFADVSPAATGVYVNFLDTAGDALVQQAYPDATYRRLAEVKARWDPENLFNGNHNIRPG